MELNRNSNLVTRALHRVALMMLIMSLKILTMLLGHVYQGSVESSCITYVLRTCQYSDIVLGAKAFQITSLAIVYSTFYSSADLRKHQSSASLAFVRGIHQWPVNSPHKWPVTRKMLPFDNVIMALPSLTYTHIVTVIVPLRERLCGVSLYGDSCH